MNPSEKIYGIDWDTSKPRAKWQFTSQNYLRVDVTEQFDARFNIIAYTQVGEEHAEKIRVKCRSGDIPCQSCGQDGFKGFDESIFDIHAGPGEYWGWRVTNCAHILPGFRHELSQARAKVASTFGPHPSDGYAVQFNAVPWGVFKRYWRKPIHLDRKFHTERRKSSFGKNRGYAMGSASIEVLDFDVTLLRTHKTFFADFSFLYANRTRTHDVNMALWMLQNVGGFRIMSDHDSPFVRIDDEVLFSIECM